MFTKFRSIAILLVALFTISNAFASSTDDFYADGFEFHTTGSREVSLARSHLSEASDIVIPAAVVNNGIKYSVVYIGYEAFAGHHMKSVTIPNSVRWIFVKAFAYCDSLSSIDIPNSVTEIDSCAFSHCSAMTSVKLGNSLQWLGENVFRDCPSLRSFDVDSQNQYYATFDGVLYDKSLTQLIICPGGRNSVTFPSTLTSIGKQAFAGNRCLTSMTIPNTVTEIGDAAFSNCTSLVTVDVGNSMRIIGTSAFYGCKHLAQVSLGNSVTEIGETAFSHCTSLTNMEIPNSVTTIGDGLFSYCDTLTSVTIGNSVTNTGASTFKYCKSLKNVIFGKSVSEIGIGSFSHCTSLTNIEIPNSVKTIGQMAFRNCDSLSSVTIGSSVEEIGSGAFYEDTLSVVTCLSIAPPKYEKLWEEELFNDNTLIQGKLYVPEESLGAYNSVDPWRNFMNIEGIAGVDDVKLDDSVNVWNDKGVIQIDGTDAPCAVYDMRGCQVAKTKERSISGLGAGVYLVKVGEQTFKVVL